jgi:hypothetical protein
LYDASTFYESTIKIPTDKSATQRYNSSRLLVPRNNLAITVVVSILGGT